MLSFTFQATIKELGKSQDQKDNEFLDSYVASNQISGKEKALFFLNALLVSAVPVAMYVTVFDMDLFEYGIFFAIVTLFSAFILQFAYSGSAYTRKAKLISEREHNSVLKGQEGNKKKSKKGDGKSEQERVTSIEASALSVVLTNLYFFAAVFVGAFVLFSRASAPYNYVLSVSLSAGFLSVLASPNLL